MEETETNKILDELSATGEFSGVMSDGMDNDNLDPFDPAKIRISKKTISLDQILRRIKNKSIVLAPEFQRNEVWNQTKKSQLIESLMLNIPIPLFYVAADENGNWDVVDGLQRLSTIKEFILDETLVLKNLEFWGEYNGRTIEDLPPLIYNRIFETEFSVIVIEPGTPDAVKYNIFKRINTGGMPLSAQEIRHALYQGNSTKILKDLSLSKEFLQATDNSINDSRMAAREIILRCLSFMILGVEGYYNNDIMDSFLRRGIQVLNYLEAPEKLIEKRIFEENILPNFNVKSYDALSSMFKLGMDRSFKIFDKNAFRISVTNAKRSSINKGLFETWGTLLSLISEDKFECLLGNKDELITKYDLMKKDSRFYTAVSTGAYQKTNVNYRFGAVRELIEEHSK